MFSRYMVNQPQEDAFYDKISDQGIKSQLMNQQGQQQLKRAVAVQLMKNMRLKQGGNPNQIVGSNGDIDYSQMENAPAKQDYGGLNAVLGVNEKLDKLQKQHTMGVLGGQEDPNEQDMGRYGPHVGGGVVTSPSGEQMGEYMPGYEPEVDPNQVAKAMREKLAPGIGMDELRRKVLGIGQPQREGLDSMLSGAASEAQPMPAGVTEDDIMHTMQKHNLTRQQVLDQLNTQ